VRRRAEKGACPSHVHVEENEGMELLWLSIPFHDIRSSRKMIIPQGQIHKEVSQIEYLDLDYKQELAFCQLKNWIRVYEEFEAINQKEGENAL
jgi:hypothetical protein